MRATSSALRTTGSATTNNSVAKELHDIRQLFHRLQHRSIESLDQLIRDAVGAAPSSPAARAPTVPLAAPPRWACHHPRRVHSTRQVPPWSWPSYVSVERRTSRALHLGTKSGAGLRPTPCARSSARVEETSGAGAPSSAVRSRHGRVQQESHPLGFESSRSHKQGNACFSHTPVLLNGYIILKE